MRFRRLLLTALTPTLVACGKSDEEKQMDLARRVAQETERQNSETEADRFSPSKMLASPLPTPVAPLQNPVPASQRSSSNLGMDDFSGRMEREKMQRDIDSMKRQADLDRMNRDIDQNRLEAAQKQAERYRQLGLEN